MLMQFAILPIAPGEAASYLTVADGDLESVDCDRTRELIALQELRARLRATDCYLESFTQGSYPPIVRDGVYCPRHSILLERFALQKAIAQLESGATGWRDLVNHEDQRVRVDQ